VIEKDTSDTSSDPVFSPADLVKYGLTASEDLADAAFARLLVLGAGKTGKTTSILKSSPGPILAINCDGEGATHPAIREGASFVEIPADTRNTWKKACETAVKLADDEKIRTIVVDTFTLLADNIVAECALTLDGFDLWKEVGKYLQNGIRRLKQAQAHLIVTCHMDPLEDEIVGITPLIPGRTKTWLPGALSDILLFEMDQTTGKRQFLVGPQKYWTHSGRKVTRSCTIEPDMKKVFAELGLEP
jgi:hypothetical protein